MNTLFPEFENHYIGTTETYDPALDYSWVDNLQIGNIIITKNLTDKMINSLLLHKEVIILHLVVTGYGETLIEPNVPSVTFNKNQLIKLLSLGFPLEQVVLRISPIIPDLEGINVVRKVLDELKEINVSRIRFSTLNVYKHIIPIFEDKGISLPYYTYSAPASLRDYLINFFADYFNISNIDEFNSDVCGEVDLKNSTIERVGCISQKDLEILGIDDKVELIGSGKQRDTCMCPNNKKQIIRRKPSRCAHGCLYCYWKPE